MDSLKTKKYIEDILKYVKSYAPNESEFHQATSEVLNSLLPILREDRKYIENSILEQLVVPDRTLMFRVPWIDDRGRINVNIGYRVQFNSTLGPYKGGLRFHPTVDLGVIKFLGFEQIFKNALTGLNIDGGKGGSDFNPKGKSDYEIMRFCQSFMNELYKHIGNRIDVPAGDIGVGAREIGYLYGHYKRLTGRFEGSLTGKGVTWGGSFARKEATGYGTVYFTQNHLNSYQQEIAHKRATVSGSGNVAIYAIEKLQEFGANVVACSDSRGTIYDESGLNLQTIKEIKEERRGSLGEYTKVHPDAIYIPKESYPDGGHAIWSIPTDIALPCATQNELTLIDAQNLVRNGVIIVSEGANMPTTPDAIDFFKNEGVLFSPAKAANAGGVAVSQLEMAQNASMVQWSFEEVDNRLHKIMENIFITSFETAKEFNYSGDLQIGSNIASFRKIADAMISLGAV